VDLEETFRRHELVNTRIIKVFVRHIMFIVCEATCLGPYMTIIRPIRDILQRPQKLL